MSGCIPQMVAVVAKAPVAAVKPVAAAAKPMVAMVAKAKIIGVKPVAHVVHRAAAHGVRRAAHPAAKAPVAKPAAIADGCARAPGAALPAGPGGFVTPQLPVAVKSIGVALAGGAAAGAAALFRADAEEGHDNDTVSSGVTGDVGGAGFGGDGGSGSNSNAGTAGASSFGGGFGGLFGSFTTQQVTATGPGNALAATSGAGGNGGGGNGAGGTPNNGGSPQPDPATAPLVAAPIVPADVAHGPAIGDPGDPSVALPTDVPAPIGGPGAPLPLTSPGGPVTTLQIPDSTVANDQPATNVPEPASILVFAVAAIVVIALHRIRGWRAGGLA